MIFYFESRTYLKIQYNNILNDINYHLDNQNKKLETLMRCLSNLNELIQKINDLDNINEIVDSLEEYKKIIDNTKDNISNLKKLKKNLNEIFPEGPVKDKFKLDSNLKTKLIDFNDTAERCKNKIYNESQQYEEFILSYVNTYTLDNEFAKDIKNDYTAIKDYSKEDSTNYSLSNYMPKSDFTILEDDDDDETNTTAIEEQNIDSDIQDNNTLIISEIDQKVYLPYTVAQLEEALSNSRKYQTLQDVIDSEYTIPMSRYKNAVISRFKETYNLMHKKEKYNVLDSLDLALELAFNRLLNPAIITACNTLDELDIYLDYLDSNEVEKFNIFKIEYKVLPRTNFTLRPAND